VSIAQRLGVTREAVYSWARRLKGEGSRPVVAQSLRDRPRSGRPRSQRQAMQEMVGQVIDTRPSQYCYQAEGWTAGLLRYHLQATRGIAVGENTVRRCLKGMGYRWKRPTYVLARRDAFWRQGKGEWISPTARKAKGARFIC
jgi:transposase